MAAAVSLTSEEQCLCPVCLDVFGQPVSLPCGHNFCKDCILGYWQVAPLAMCPMCKQRFPRRPELRVNTFIAEVASQFRGAAPAGGPGRTGEVPCDVCQGKRVGALKSCLDCLASYCGTHLEPHHVLEAFSTHRLLPPSMGVQERVCAAHRRPLDGFCGTDGAAVCGDCARTDHRRHGVVPLEEEARRRRSRLGEEEVRLQLTIRARLEEVGQVEAAASQGREAAAREVEESERTFSALQRVLEEGRAEALEAIGRRLTEAELRAQGRVRELEEEVEALRRRSEELGRLSHSEDPLHVIRQSGPLLPAPPPGAPPPAGCPPPGVPPPPDPGGPESAVEYVGTLRRALRGAGSRLEEALREEVRRLTEAEVLRVRRWAADVTLDPDTAHPKLLLSRDGRQVRHGDGALRPPEAPGRFYPGTSVLGRDPLARGRLYYEVRVAGKTEWDLGVCRESVDRKGGSLLNPGAGYWALGRRAGGEHWALGSPPVLLPLPAAPLAVGVYLDLEAGQVSFYDAGRGAHLYSFTGAAFTEPLRPYFNPRRHQGGHNAAPLVLTPLPLPRGHAPPPPGGHAPPWWPRPSPPLVATPLPPLVAPPLPPLVALPLPPLVLTPLPPWWPRPSPPWWPRPTPPLVAMPLPPLVAPPLPPLVAMPLPPLVLTPLPPWWPHPSPPLVAMPLPPLVAPPLPV